MKFPVLTVQREGAVARYESADLTTPLRDWGRCEWERMLCEDDNFNGRIRAIVLTRFRWEVRNNPLLAGIAGKFSSALGSPTLRARTNDKAYNAKAETAFWTFAQRVTVGTDDADTLVQVSKQIVTEMLLAGEVFAILLNTGRIQLVPSEFCGSCGDKIPENEKNGIGRNADGSISYYRFSKSRNSANPDFSYDNTETVDARYVIHIFDKDRIAMGRGIPWLLSSLTTAHDLMEIVRAKTKQIKDAASICGTWESDTAVDALTAMANADGLGGALTGPPPDIVVTDGPKQSKAAVELKPGTFFPLRPGEKFNVLSSEYEADDYKELVMLMLSMISAPIGLPVEIWFSGMGEVNFSGSKALGVQWADRRREYIRFFEDKFFNRLYRWRTSRDRIFGDLPANPQGDDSLVKWAWKASATLDPERDARANKIRLESGQASLATIWEEQDLFADEEIQNRVNLWETAQRIAKLPPSEPPMSWLLGSQIVPNPTQKTLTQKDDENA